MKKSSTWKSRLYEIVFEADTSAGKAFDLTLLVLIILSTITVMVETVPEVPAHYAELFFIAEWFFTIIFTIEFILRIVSAPRVKIHFQLSWHHRFPFDFANVPRYFYFRCSVLSCYPYREIDPRIPHF